MPRGNGRAIASGEFGYQLGGFDIANKGEPLARTEKPLFALLFRARSGRILRSGACDADVDHSGLRA